MQYEYYDTDLEAMNRVSQHHRAGRRAYFLLLCQNCPGGYEVRSWVSSLSLKASNI
jgi:hypothetical protein